MRIKTQHIDRYGEIVHEEINHFTDSFNDKGYRFQSNKAGIRSFRNVQLPSEMSYADKGRLYDLCNRYLVGDTNILGCATGHGPRAITIDEIADLVGLAGWKGRKWVNKLVRLHVFHKVKDTSGEYQFWVNPAYLLFSGHRVTVQQYLIFKKELDPILPQWAIVEFNRRAAVEPLTCKSVLDEAEYLLEVNHV